MKRLIILILSSILIGCERGEVVPQDFQGPLIKTITQYNEGSETPGNVSNYTYDNRNRIIQITNSGGGWFTPSSIRYEYMGECQINMYLGDNLYEMQLNDRGDPIRINDDVFEYKYFSDRIEVTITSDSESWEETHKISNGNIIETIDEDFNLHIKYSFDSKPNFRECIQMHNSSCNTNNVIQETSPDNYTIEFAYTYDNSGYVTAYTRTYTAESYESITEYIIEYY